MANENKAKKKIDPNEIKTRDPLMVSIINGATKGGIQKDKKKEDDKKKCREKLDTKEEVD